MKTISILIMATAFVVASSALALTYVSPDGGHVAPYDSWANAATNIQAAVDAALDSDTILVTNGTYLLSSAVHITKDITLRSVNGPDVTTVDGNLADRCFYVDHSDPIIDGFTITRGLNSGGRGGGVWLEYGGTVSNCVLVGNEANIGGGVHCDHGGMVSHCTIVSNTATWGGGAYAWYGGGVLRNCLIAHNEASSKGGGFRARFGGEVQSCTIVSNSAPAGGGIGVQDCDEIVNTIIYHNSATSNPDIHLDDANTVFNNSCSSIDLNSYGANNLNSDPTLFDVAGSDFRLLAASPCLDNGTNQAWMGTGGDLDGNTRIQNGIVDMGAYEGGVMPSAAVLYVSLDGGHVAPYDTWANAATNIQAAIDLSVDGNTVIVSNGTYVVSSQIDISKGVTVRALEISRAAIHADQSGRCVYLNHADAVLDGFVVMRGKEVNGGGAYVQAGTVRYCHFDDCEATGRGGAVYLQPDGTLAHSYIFNNKAGIHAGGVWCNYGGTVRNCVVTENQAAQHGGGVLLYNGGTLESSTITMNRADLWGGGLACWQGGTVLNSIIYGNWADLHDDYYNDLGGMTYSYCCADPAPAGTGNIGADPQFVDAVTGRWNFRLQKSSPCLDAGSNQGWMAATNDLNRVYPRISGGTVDLGAYEWLHTRYVSTSGGNSAPYTSWATAATSIQNAIDAAADGERVLVSNGTYNVSSAIAIDKPIEVTSLNGAESTTVDAGNSSRCFEISDAGATLSGFSVVNGDAGSGWGGGIQSNPGATIENCDIRDCSAAFGGGIYIRDGGIVRNCLAAGNTAAQYGGGIRAYLGDVLIENCTLSGNTAQYGGGLALHDGTARNSIAYGNSAPNGANIYSGGTVDYIHCCADPAPAGTDNFDDDPLFEDAGSGDYRIEETSPCIDAGQTLSWMRYGVDLDGHARLSAEQVDVGAYERRRVRYVSPAGSHTWPYLTPATAANDIQTAINAARPKDTVLIKEGTYPIPAPVNIGKDICVKGEKREEVVIDGQNAVQGVQIAHANAVLQDVTVIQCASPSNGGGVLVENGAKLYGVAVKECQAQNGAGVYMEDGGKLHDCLLVNNTAANEGGGLVIEGAAEVSHCTIARNSAVAGGGMVVRVPPPAPVNIENTICYENTASSSNDNWHTEGPVQMAHVIASPQPAGAGNLDADPRFFAPDNDDFGVKRSSPAVDAARSNPPAEGDFLIESITMDAEQFCSIPEIRIPDTGGGSSGGGGEERIGPFDPTNPDIGDIHPPQPNVRISKSCNKAEANPGENVVFTVEIENYGEGACWSVSVEDLLPPGLSFQSWFAVHGDYTPANGEWKSMWLNNLHDAETLTITAQVDAGAPLGGTIVNTAEVTSVPGGDGDASDNTATASVYVPAADIWVSKGRDPAQLNEGETVKFILNVKNNGPDEATGLKVRDYMPAAFTYLSNSVPVGSFNDANLEWDLGTVASGVLHQGFIWAQAKNGAGNGIHTNIIQVSALDQGDPNLANNTYENTVEIYGTVDLSIDKTVDDGRPQEGDLIEYTVTVHNAGPDSAKAISINDLLPADVTYGSHSASQGSYNSGSGLWTAGDLGVGATATLTIEASVNSGTAGGPDIVNTASLNDVCQEDTDPSNNSDTASIHVALVDLEVAKTVDEPRPNEGDTITYTITVDNSGPDYASLVDISDLLPSGVTYDSDTTSQGSYDDGTGVWTVGQIDAGNSAILEIEAIVDAGTAGGPDITNAVAVASVNEDETDTADNSDTATIHVPLVDVSIAKSIAVPADSAPNANEGDPVTFTITATNAGPDYASELRIGDVLNGFTMTGNSATLGSYNGATWSIAQLDPGDSATLTIDATVDAGTGGTTLANTAAVASVHEKDADNGNDSDSVDVYIELSDIELSKTGALLECAEQWTVPLSKGNGDGDYRLRIAGDQPIFHIMGYGDIAGAGGASCDYHHVAARFTAATNSWGPHTLELFIDGVKVNTHTSGGTLTDSGGNLVLGSYLGSSAFFSGALDEMRFSRVARSDAWLQTTYNQQHDPDTFISIGAEEPGSLLDYKKTLTIDNSKVGGDLADFPVLVNIEDIDLKTAADGGHVESEQGYDIQFTLPDGSALDHEIERYTGNEGRLIAWVRLPTVSGTVDTEFVIHYGDATIAAPTENPAGVWDGDFAVVQHCEELAGDPATDSTSFGNDGAISGATPTHFGQTGGAFIFDGEDDKIEIPHSASLKMDDGDFTIETWYLRRPLPGDAWYRIVVENKGPDRADDVVVEDRISDQTIIEHYTETGTFVGNVWDIGSLEVGQTVTNWLLATSSSTGAVENCAEVMEAEQADHDSPHGNDNYSEDDQDSALLGGVPIPAWMKPDFVLDAVVMDPDDLEAGDAFSVEVTIRNHGYLPGNAGVLGIWVDNGAGGAPDATLAIGSLAVGESKTVTVSGLNAPATAGWYNLRAEADANGITPEMSEGDNHTLVNYEVEDGSTPSTPSWMKPDFVLDAVVMDPADLETGDAFSVEVSIRNHGYIAGDAGELGIWVDNGGGGAPDATLAIGSLAVGESKTVTVSGLNAPATAGWYNLRAEADANGITPEMSEGDNHKLVNYEVTGGVADWRKPDFVVTDVTIAPLPLRVGEAFSADIVLYNQGHRGGDAGELGIWVDNSAGGAPDASVAIGSLAVGETRTLSVSGLVAPQNGWYNLRAEADYANIVLEMSEGNNHHLETYEVKAIKSTITRVGDDVEIRWESRADEYYNIFYSTNIVVGFELLEGNIEATPPENVHVHVDAPDDFCTYRVEVDH